MGVGDISLVLIVVITLLTSDGVRTNAYFSFPGLFLGLLKDLLLGQQSAERTLHGM